MTDTNESDIGRATIDEGNIKMADHKQGSMDIRVQEKTFDGFIRMVTWGAVISIGVLIFMALTNA